MMPLAVLEAGTPHESPQGGLVILRTIDDGSHRGVHLQAREGGGELVGIGAARLADAGGIDIRAL
jgi:hypothetical protein